MYKLILLYSLQKNSLIEKFVQIIVVLWACRSQLARHKGRELPKQNCPKVTELGKRTLVTALVRNTATSGISLRQRFKALLICMHSFLA